MVVGDIIKYRYGVKTSRCVKGDNFTEFEVNEVLPTSVIGVTLTRGKAYIPGDEESLAIGDRTYVNDWHFYKPVTFDKHGIIYTCELWW
jgi:hypothetical protein